MANYSVSDFDIRPLWNAIHEWIPSYRCQVCCEIMSKKSISKSPQKINSCGHFMCARCIIYSYYIELNPICPVKGCMKCINPRDEKKAKVFYSDLLYTFDNKENYQISNLRKN